MKISKEHLRKLVEEAVQESFEDAPRDYLDDLEDQLETCMYMIMQCQDLTLKGYRTAAQEKNLELADDLKLLHNRFRGLESITKNILQLRFGPTEEL